MSAHTPGPWVVDGRRGGVWQGKVDRINGLRIAVVDLSVGREEEDQANACLIAAAPELLEALRLVMAEADFGDEELKRRCLAAIAKAVQP